MKDLGLWLDNHDFMRFLTQHNNDKRKLENAITIVHTWIGIPIMYYGTE